MDRSPASVQAIARAGAGTNNIPVEAMSARGVPVFNAPGANANAVKELVLAGMLMAARQPRAGAALRRRARRQGEPTSTRPSKTARRRSPASSWRGQHAGRDRPGQDRLPGGRCGHQAGHAGARLRPRHHRRRGLEPAVAGQARRQRQRGAEGRALRDAARAAGGGHAQPGQRRRTSACCATTRCCSTSRAKAWSPKPPCWRRSAAKRLAAYVCDFPSAVAAAPRRCHRAAAFGCQHARGRGELRRDGGRPAARLPRARQRRQRGELPQRVDGRASRRFGWRSPMPTCPTCWARSPPRWRTRA